MSAEEKMVLVRPCQSHRTPRLARRACYSALSRRCNGQSRRRDNPANHGLPRQDYPSTTVPGRYVDAVAKTEHGQGV